jgi:hypothetical protein
MFCELLLVIGNCGTSLIVAMFGVLRFKTHDADSLTWFSRDFLAEHELKMTCSRADLH